MNVRDYRDGDIIRHRSGDNLLDGMNEVLRNHSVHTKVIEMDGEVVAMFGLAMRWQGVADVWAVVTDGARGHGCQLTREARKLVDRYAFELGLWRMSALVHEGVPEYQRWICLLGFEPEGREHMGAPDGADFIRYTRLWPWAAPLAHRLQ